MKQMLREIIRRNMKNESGITLVAVAIIAFFVALIALTTLALTQSQIVSIDDQTESIMARRTAETGLEHAMLALKHLDANVNPSEVSGISDYSSQEITSLFLGGGTDDGTSPDTTEFTGYVYDEDPERIFYTAFERSVGETADASDISTIKGDSNNVFITYIDDATVVKDYLEYDYKKTDNEVENFVVSLGEVRKSASDARSAVSARAFTESDLLFEKRDVQTQVFNQNHPEPPYIESEHDPYDPSETKSWVVAYSSDPAHPNRTITGIELIFEPQDIGLGSAGDQLSFRAWNGTQFEPAFDIIAGPKMETTQKYITNTPFPTKAIKIDFASDTIEESDDPINQFNYGFRVSGVGYHYDSDKIPALYETPHPYAEIESNASWLAKPDLTQVIYSPFALPKNSVIPIDTGGDGIFTPGGTGTSTVNDMTGYSTGSYEGSELPVDYYDKYNADPVGNNEFQIMRIHFDPRFSLESGDTLDVYNTNNGTLIAKYIGISGADVWTPYAFRTNPDFPLALSLDLVRDGNNDASSDDYGYLVDMLEYSDENGDLKIIVNPTQKTAHEVNMGYNDGMAGLMRSTIVFKPANPVGGGTVTNWKVVFNTDANLINKIGDADRITLKRSAILSGFVPDQNYVAPDGFYAAYLDTMSPLFDPNYHSIEELRGLTMDMGQRLWLEIVTEFDARNSFASEDENYGWNINRIEVTYDDAIGVDASPPKLRSSSMAVKGTGDTVANVLTVSYPEFGQDTTNRGEWWVTSKDEAQILIHFDLDRFRLKPGDEIRIYDEGGYLVKQILPEGDDVDYNPDDIIVIGGDTEDNTVSFDYVPNPPQELIDTHGWVLVSSESAQIVLLGDGFENYGYSGFELDRVAYWSPVSLIRNVKSNFSKNKTSDYVKTKSRSSDKYYEY